MKHQQIVSSFVISALAGLLFPMQPARAQSDSLNVAEINKKEEKNRNVMLNATTQTKPREVSIGLPGSDWGSVIFEDGLPVSYSSWPVYYYFKWAGGNAYLSQGLMKAGESAIQGSSIGYSINSYTRLGGDSLKAIATLSSSSFCLLRGDAHVSGPMGRGWYYSASAYANYDPTSVHPKQRRYVNQSQLYKAALTKRWERTSLSLLYKYVMNNDALTATTSRRSTTTATAASRPMRVSASAATAISPWTTRWSTPTSRRARGLKTILTI